MPITVVTGPPCSGKSTYVAEHRAPEDIVLDLDAIAHALGYPDTHVDWSRPHAAVEAARAARTELLKAVLARSIVNAWIIDAEPPAFLLKKYRAIGADVVDLDPGRKVCIARAKAERTPDTVRRIRDWYDARS